MRANRQLLHAAGAIRDRLRHRRNEPLPLPGAGGEELGGLLRRLDRAAQRGWTLAAERLRQRLRTVVARHRAGIEEVHRVLTTPPPPVPTLSELYADLRALEEDFEEVRFERRTRRLVVRTAPVELEGVFLGRFDVVLRLDDWEQPSPYDVVAVEPNPASANSGVTHPHVDSEGLCEGEGRFAIRHALDGGRLHDVLQIVDRILRTYNPGSAYVSLRDWEGVDCSDCGTTIDDDERFDCGNCRAELCGDCSPCCGDCGTAHCFDCLDRCAACDERFCSSCLRRCPGCGEDHCEEHLDDDHHCPTCRDRLEEETGEPTTTPAADPVRDGQAAVPA